MQVVSWGSLNLRWQAAIAVVLPCAAIALFSSLYFPARLNSQAERSLERRAHSLGALASAEAAPVLRLVSDGLAQPEDLDVVFAGSAGGTKAMRPTSPGPAAAGATNEVDLSGTDIEYIGVLKVKGPSVTPDATTVVRKSGVLPEAPIAIPTGSDGKPGGCGLDHGKSLVLRCYLRDADTEGLFVAAFKRDELLEAQRQNLVVGLWSAVGAIGLGLLLAWFFSGALAEPVAQLTQAAREVAAGDVTISAIEVSAAGEIRSMAGSFNEMLASLRTLVGQMVSLTGRLGSASKGLIGASKDQEHVTNQQAAYAQEIAATFEELSRTAEQISTSTEVVETAARNTNQAVEQARAVVAQVTAGIKDIRGESKEVAESITRLNSDLQQVSKIAQVINTVAERSDLLALNAALEGTKAGEVGRGFSLVAAEMRKLAESVSASARDIGRIVEKIQESGNEAVAKARVGVATSDKGVEVSEQAVELFQRIVELARGTTEAAQQISVATRQQKQSSEQAVQGARNVADLVKRGVDATGRTHLIAQDLEGVAQALSAVTSKFKVVES